MEKNRREKGSFRERALRALDLPPDCFAGGYLIEVRDRYSVTVCGCLGILVYTPERIVLSLRDSRLYLAGEKLTCASYRDGTVRIEGKMREIGWEEEEA